MKKRFCTPTAFVILCVALALELSVMSKLAAADDTSTEIALELRSRRESGDGGRRFEPVIQSVKWNAKRTAVIVCDMWNDHTCKGAAARVAEMAPAVDRTIKVARDKGALIIHAPSGCMSVYADTPQRRRAIAAPPAKAPVAIKWNNWDEEREGPPFTSITHGGCNCKRPCPGFDVDEQGVRKWSGRLPIPWSRQIDTVEIADADAISDNGQEIYNLLEARNIDNVILMGVHTNICVSGRPFGLRQMVYFGKHVVLCRDLTDALFQTKSPEIDQFRGTELVVEHIEEFICPTITSTSLTGQPAFRFTADVAADVADKAADAQIPAIPRTVPPPGIQLPAQQRERLARRVQDLKKRLEGVKNHPLAADAEIFIKAVDFALRHDEFYAESEIARADTELRLADERLAALAEGKSPWRTERRLVVRGYRSSIDGSAQPYGLVIPDELDLTRPVPLYVWLHGRGDKTTDLHFIHNCLSRRPNIAPQGAIVLEPFGRHCIGFKSAGEIDVLDAIDHVSSQYPIDPDRVVLMGFSMGGAGAWHIGAHYADHFVAMSPGAGFAETAQYNKLKPADYPPSYEQTLWTLYDVPNYTRNLFNLPCVAYSGEIDPQQQAARVMEAAFQSEGRQLPHVIGPGMGHRYHPDSLADIMRQMAEAVERGRDRNPKKITLQTRTLRYNKMHWLELLRLERHWQDTRADAEVADDGTLVVTTKNVASLRLHGWENRPAAKITIDGQPLEVPSRPPMTPPFLLVKSEDQGWRWDRDDTPHGENTATGATASAAKTLVKRHGLQGPIDDAFMAPFLVVAPSGTSKHPRVEQWVEFELQHFLNRWRALYRGEVRLKQDRDVTDDDMAHYHLILWGDPESNSVIQRIVAELPITWNETTLAVAGQSYEASSHVPLMIYPNPLRPDKYIVLNSGPTHREGHDRTNSLQNPKLPDWAVIDIRQPPDAFTPGRVVAADFFDERWANSH